MTQNKSKTLNKQLIIIIIVSVLIVSSVLAFRFSDNLFGDSLGSDHQHALFRVIIEDQRVSFDLNENPQYIHGNEYILMESVPYLIHRYSVGATLEMFFEGLGMEFTDSCFKLDKPLLNTSRTEYCNEGQKTLKFYVNGVANDEFEKYIPMDEDHVLIIYGDQSEEVINEHIEKFDKLKHKVILEP